MPEIANALKACVICGSSIREFELLVGEFQILRCSCGLRTLFPEPKENELLEVFDDGSIYGQAESLRSEILQQNRRSLADVEKVRARGTLLDVGCGLGFMLEAARESGWEAVGVDTSAYSVRRAQEHGFQAHKGMLQDAAFPAGSFDCVSLLQVVEHLLDPRPMFAECARVLKPGGAILVETPNPVSLLARVKRESFNYWIPPVHCVWYTPDALARALRDAGFRPAQVRTWSAKTTSLHDGLAIVDSVKFGRALPRRIRLRLGDAVAAAADAARRGTIVEVVAIRSEDK